MGQVRRVSKENGQTCFSSLILFFKEEINYVKASAKI